MQTQPQNEELEMAVIGAIIDHDSMISIARKILQPQDFYKITHQYLFKACCELDNRSESITILSLHNELRAQGNLAECGGVDYLMRVSNEFHATSSFETHAKLVKDKSLKRSMIVGATNILKDCFQDKESALDIINDFDKTLMDVKDGNTLMSDLETKQDVIDDVWEEMTTPSEFKGLPITDISELNQKTNGAEPGDLIILAGRTGMGKSIGANTITTHFAKLGIAGVQYNLEMTKRSALKRFVSCHAEVNYTDITRGRVDKSVDGAAIQKAMDCYNSDVLFIEDKPGMSVMDLRSSMFMYKNKYDIKWAIIDHGLLIPLEKGGSNDAAKIGNVTRLLKQTAKELGIPIFLLWQLNRGDKAESTAIPGLNTLKGSGSVSEDADKCIFIHRDAYFPDKEIPDGEELLATWNVAKCRAGSTGYVKTKFNIDYARFEAWEDPFYSASTIGGHGSLTPIIQRDNLNPTIKITRETRDGIMSDIPF